MTKSERLLKLLTLLQNRRRAITAATLAEQLQVSERTIYRDIQSLIATGVPIKGEAGIGYLLQKGSTLAPLMFNEEQLEALILGVRMVQSWGDQSLGTSADSALEKIRAVIPERLHYLRGIAQETLLVPKFQYHQPNKFSETIRDAIKSQNKIWVSYTKLNGGDSERILWPLGLEFWGKVWTLIAWCEMRNAYRVFRLDLIADVKLLEQSFQTTENRSLKNYLENCYCD